MLMQEIKKRCYEYARVWLCKFTKRLWHEHLLQLLWTQMIMYSIAKLEQDGADYEPDARARSPKWGGVSKRRTKSG